MNARSIATAIALSALIALTAEEASMADDLHSADSTATAVATLGGGCFWCLEAVFEELQGVAAVRSGFAGGHVADPSYREVCDGGTGHAEVVQIRFDPARVSYEEILAVFFGVHDPTTRDRQGADVGSQYRSIILYHDEAQHEAAAALIKALDAEKIWKDPIVTELAAFTVFYPAEDYHQDYYALNSSQPYCRIVISPKLEKFREEFAAKLKAPAQR